MAEQAEVGCARPTGGPVGGTTEKDTNSGTSTAREERNMIMVGQKAPDLTAPGYQKGQFVNVKLFGLSRPMGAPLFLSGRFHLCVSYRDFSGR